jgi:hypothetical protein
MQKGKRIIVFRSKDYAANSTAGVQFLVMKSSGTESIKDFLLLKANREQEEYRGLFGLSHL